MATYIRSVLAAALVLLGAVASAATTPITYYLSEGATGPFFDEDLLISNPNDAVAPVTLTFSKENGEQVVATRSVPARGHLTVHVWQIPGLEATSASAQIRSDAGLPLVVERTMFWDKSYYAGSTGSSVDKPSKDWLFAEGSQGFFQTFVLVINPNATATDVTFTFLLEGAAPVVKTMTVGPSTRLTLDAGSVPELVNKSFGIAVHAAQPIMAERSMYFGTTPRRLWSGGTESAGVTAASTKWFLAEGATGGFFDTFILLSNPQSSDAHVTLQYLLDNGQTISVPKVVPANARLTINIESEDDTRLHNAAVSTVVISDVPIIAERSMYWPGYAYPWGEGHNSFGVVDAGTTWGLAEGRTGGPYNFHTYILLANPQTTTANVTVNFLRENGAPVAKTYTVAPTSRYNIDVGSVTELQNESFGAVIQVSNNVPIIVERSMYWDSNGFTFSGGTNATGIALPASTTVIPGTPGDGGGGTGGCQNLVADPGFESGTSNFVAQDASSSVTQSSTSPIEGAHSLAVVINGYGNNVWWNYNFSGGKASKFTVGAHLRSDVASTSDLQFCAWAYYSDGSAVKQCQTVHGSAGDKGVVTATLNLDSTKELSTVNILLSQVGSQSVHFSVDAVTTCLTVVQAPPNGGGPGGGGGGGGGGTGSPSCTPSPNTIYPGFTYTTPAARPYIPLDPWSHSDPNGQPYKLFKQFADAALANPQNPPYLYSATDSVLMYKLTGQLKYLQDAIARVDTDVTQSQQEIQQNGQPELANDSYYFLQDFIEPLALTYDYGFSQLTPDQRTRWAALADQAIFNVWHPDQATWGGVAQHWSGWAICDPGNNYYYNFLRSTMLWGWASQNQDTLNFLKTQKFPLLVDYFAALPGGGTREGTGYGTSLNDLFGNYLYWKASTGEDLSALSPHTRDTIDYWVHATVPTLDRFAPIGDLSRESIPNLYQYQENLVHQAVALSPSTAQASRGVWWLQNNSVTAQEDFNVPTYLLPYPATPVAPTAKMYHSAGAGAGFARSSWATNASWIATVAGKYDQSHAHHDQGSFTFFKRDWLVVTSNIWSHSGIQQGDEVHNVLRFEQNGSVIGQNQDDGVASTMTPTETATGATIAEDLTNAYSAHRTQIHSWTRNLVLNGDVLSVHDVCSVAAGVTPIFQLHVPVQPTQQPDGSITAGNLHIIPLLPVHPTFVYMPSTDSDFNSGWRIELRIDSGCEFNLELHAQ